MSGDSNVYPNAGAIEALASHYSLVLPERQRAARMGEYAGRRAGSSIEFQDRKDYVPGDDLRHIDWRAFARTDRLSVKLYREEICPTVDIVIDVSESMAVSPEKSLRRIDLAYLMEHLALRLSAQVRVHALGDDLRPLYSARDAWSAPARRCPDPLPRLLSAPFLRRAGIKILVSDFLFPCDPAHLVHAFAAADRLVLLQVLSAFEADPPVMGATRLEEAESGAQLDLSLDSATVRGYRTRLTALQEELERQARIAGGVLAVVREDDGLKAMARRLADRGVIAA